ncbi:hypothetical protein CHS0354_016209 [Potamilus streckersoni]|uniref:Uncharacterized protein n=1 Tax=Potamilus streckersoni TaxID=2493646 RepID=A0AAE0RXX7_9BIVA|nr:hypothetical protein CHS0354_016209 [Potamilus streckersoni]
MIANSGFTTNVNAATALSAETVEVNTREHAPKLPPNAPIVKDYTYQGHQNHKRKSDNTFNELEKLNIATSERKRIQDKQ